MLRKIFNTPNESSLLIMRVLLATVMFAHGAQKLLGWWGGYGFEGTMGFFTQNAGIPAFLAFMVIFTEFFGSIMLAFGFLSRIWALGIGTVLTVAMLTVHLPNGFFMNWSGQQQGEGIEFFVLGLALSIALVKNGGGRWSVDRVLAERMGESRAQARAESRVAHVAR